MKKSSFQCLVSNINQFLFHFDFTLFLLIMLRHVVLLLMFSAFLPESLQGDDQLVLAESEEGKRFLGKKRQTKIDDVGTDYSGLQLQGDFIDRSFSD